MNKKLIQANIWKYYVFNAFRELLFFAPIIVLFLQENGLSFTEIMILQSFFSICIVLLEVPTGAVADKIGRKQSMIYGSGSLVLGAIIYGSAFNFYHFMAAELTWALGLSLISGADSALLFDTLKILKRENEFKKHEGRAKALLLVFAGLGALIGAFIGAIKLRYAVIYSAIPMACCFIFSFWFKEPQHYIKVNKPKYWHLIFQSFKFVSKHKLIRWYVIFTALTFGSHIMFWAYQPFLIMSGWEVYQFGFIFVIFNITAAIGSTLSDRFENTFGKFNSLIIISLFIIIPFFTLPFYAVKLGFLFILFHQLVRGLLNPILNHAILEYTFADKRATVLSIKSLIYRMTFTLVGPVFGYAIDALTLLQAIFLFGIISTIILTAWFIVYLFIPKKYFKIKVKVKKKQ